MIHPRHIISEGGDMKDPMGRLGQRLIEIIQESMMVNKHIFCFFVIFPFMIGCKKEFVCHSPFIDKTPFPSCEKSAGMKGLLWSFESAHSFIFYLVAGDINNDGNPEVVVGASLLFAGGDVKQKGVIYALNGKDGSTLWTFEPNYEGESVCGVSSLADVDCDGRLEVLISCTLFIPTKEKKEKIFVLNGEDGSLLWDYDPFGIPGIISIADVDGDKSYEVIFGISYSTFEEEFPEPPDFHYIYALNGENGSLFWKFSMENDAWGAPLLGDVDKDGKIEIGIGTENIHGSLPFKFYLLNGEDGSPFWDFSLYSGERIAGYAFIDINNDGRLEVVASGDGEIYILKWDGSLMWSVEGHFLLSGKINDHFILLITTGRIVYKDDEIFLPITAINEYGKVIWEAKLPPHIIFSGLIGDIDGDEKLNTLIYSKDSSNFIYSMNLEDGSLSLIYEEATDCGSEESVCILYPSFIGDMNGDCILDVVAFDIGGIIKVISTGASVPSPHLLPWPMARHDVKNTGLYTGDPYPPW